MIVPVVNDCSVIDFASIVQVWVTAFDSSWRGLRGRLRRLVRDSGLAFGGSVQNGEFRLEKDTLRTNGQRFRRGR